MKTKLLRKLRAQANKKFTVEPRTNDQQLLEYHILLNNRDESKTIIKHPYLDEAIVMRNNLRRNDIMKNLDIIRYHKTIKKFK